MADRTPDASDDELTLSEAAELLGMTRQALHSQIQNGAIPAHEGTFRIERRGWLLHRADVEAYKRIREERDRLRARAAASA